MLIKMSIIGEQQITPNAVGEIKSSANEGKLHKSMVMRLFQSGLPNEVCKIMYIFMYVFMCF